MISYDDTQSFGMFSPHFLEAVYSPRVFYPAAKGKFIAESGLRGFALWEAASDYKDMLIDSLMNAAGVDVTDEDC